METALTLIVGLAVAVFGLYGYDLLVSLAGFWPLKRLPPARELADFAILICAHNEERVVAAVVRSLLTQDYPSEKIHVFVVADNCTDRTAERARSAGAQVLVRSDPVHRTKGYALQWGMEHVLQESPFDALCVFDADNLVAPDFMATMNAYLASGHVAIQAYLDTRNPSDSWVTRCIALAYFVTNRFWLRSRARLGLPATLGGTGFCLAREIAVRYRWDPGSLADDLDLTMKLVFDGVRVSYCYETRTFDEKPLTLRAALRQRSRWMQGHNDVALRWIGPMVWGALRRPSMRCFDAALHLLQPIRLLLAFCLLIALAVTREVWPEHPALAPAFHFTNWALGIAVTVFVVYPLIVAASEGALRRALAILLPFLLFSFTWIPAIVTGLARVRRRIWQHTPHGIRAP